MNPSVHIKSYILFLCGAEHSQAWREFGYIFPQIFFTRVVFDITCKNNKQSNHRSITLKLLLPLKNTSVVDQTVNCKLLIISHVLYNHIVLWMENATKSVELNFALIKIDMASSSKCMENNSLQPNNKNSVIKECQS